MVIAMSSYSSGPPKAKKWQKSERWQVGLWDNRYPLCGLRCFWVLVGTKWVYMAAPICETKIKMKRTEWNGIKDKERLHTQEELDAYKERKRIIWEEAARQRIAIENGTYTKPKRKYKKKDADAGINRVEKQTEPAETDSMTDRPKKIQSALDRLASLR